METAAAQVEGQMKEKVEAGAWTWELLHPHEEQAEAEVDPIQFEVIRNALLEATEEMAIALR